MYNFKQLEWRSQEEFDGIYADIPALKWRYSIINHNNGNIEFALLDANYEYVSDFPKLCASVTEAQNKAIKHYSSLLEQLIA